MVLNPESILQERPGGSTHSERGRIRYCYRQMKAARSFIKLVAANLWIKYTRSMYICQQENQKLVLFDFLVCTLNYMLLDLLLFIRYDKYT